MSTATDLLYQHETDAFLRIFAKRDSAQDNSATLRTRNTQEGKQQAAEILKDAQQKLGHASTDPDEQHYGRMHPISVAKTMLQGLGLDSTKLMPIVRTSFRRDKETGYFTKECMPTMVGLAHLHAQANKTPVCLVEGDFCNMGGCNGILGREGTDKLIHEICALTKDTFEKYAHRKSLKIEIQPARVGGDEVRLLVYGLNKAQTDEILESSVHPAINLLAAKYGIHNVPHTKSGKLPGFGAAFASVDLSKITNLADIRTQLDVGIENQKIDDGLLRAGMIDATGVDRYIDHHKEARTARAKLIEQVEKRGIKEKWQALIAKDGAYHDVYLASHASNPYDFFNHQKMPNVETQLAQIKLTDNTVSMPFADVHLTDNVRSRLEAPEVLRLRRALKAFGFQSLADAHTDLFQWNTKERRYELNRPSEMKDGGRLQRMVIDLMRLLDAPDPVSRCKTASRMVADIEDHMKQHGPVRVAHFELSNVNGLNYINYDLADAALRETGKFIQEGLLQHNHYVGEDGHPHNLGTHILDLVYHEGGGKFKIFLPRDYPNDAIDQVADHVNERIHKEICDKRIDRFAESTYAHRGAYDGTTKQYSRAQESQQKLAALEERLELLEDKTPNVWTWMGDVPHPKELHKALGLRHYCGDDAHPAIIGQLDDIAQRLKEISDKAEHHFAKEDRKHQPVAAGV